MNTNTEIRLPNITGGTEKEQLRQIRSYLYQTAQQLQFALGSITQAQTRTEQKADEAKAAAREAADPGATFNSIKSLIIKSAEIVDAYYEEVNRRLEGQYVASSDFGTYAQATSQQITENSEWIARVFTNVQSIRSDLEQVKNTTLEVNAYVRTGLLYYGADGNPVYGLEIGQQNREAEVVTFHKYARFTAGKLSFYDNNDTEVGYFADYQMHITNARVSGTLAVGGYEMDTTDGIAYKWAER